MRRMILRASILAATCLAAGMAVAATSLLSPAEIKATFATGTAFTATSVAGTANSFVLKPDGTASRTTKGSTAPVTGTWRVSAKGYCSKWANGRENCYTIAKGADGKYSVLDAHNKVVATWTK